jgi:hypothetical protein
MRSHRYRGAWRDEYLQSRRLFLSCWVYVSCFVPQCQEIDTSSIGWVWCSSFFLPDGGDEFSLETSFRIKIRTMDNLQKIDHCIKVPSSRTSISYFLLYRHTNVCVRVGWCLIGTESFFLHGKVVGTRWCLVPSSVEINAWSLLPLCLYAFMTLCFGTVSKFSCLWPSCGTICLVRTA